MKRLVVVFPGIGYTADKPLLYYGLAVAGECGYQENRKLRFVPLDKNNIRGNEAAMKAAFGELFIQAEEQLKDVEWNCYDDILFLSKSIGTIIACAYAAKHGITTVRHVLYTPLKFTYQYDQHSAIAFIGTADAWGDYQEVVALSEEAGIPIRIFDGCNHSLEVAGDADGNINRLAEIMKVTRGFIENSIETGGRT